LEISNRDSTFSDLVYLGALSFRNQKAVFDANFVSSGELGRSFALISGVSQPKWSLAGQSVPHSIRHSFGKVNYFTKSIDVRGSTDQGIKESISGEEALLSHATRSTRMKPASHSHFRLALAIILRARVNWNDCVACSSSMPPE